MFLNTIQSFFLINYKQQLKMYEKKFVNSDWFWPDRMLSVFSFPDESVYISRLINLDFRNIEIYSYGKYSDHFHLFIFSHRWVFFIDTILKDLSLTKFNETIELSMTNNFRKWLSREIVDDLRSRKEKKTSHRSRKNKFLSLLTLVKTYE